MKLFTALLFVALALLATVKAGGFYPYYYDNRAIAHGGSLALGRETFAGTDTETFTKPGLSQADSTSAAGSHSRKALNYYYPYYYDNRAIAHAGSLALGRETFAGTNTETFTKPGLSQADSTSAAASHSRKALNYYYPYYYDNRAIAHAGSTALGRDTWAATNTDTFTKPGLSHADSNSASVSHSRKALNYYYYPHYDNRAYADASSTALGRDTNAVTNTNTFTKPYLSHSDSFSAASSHS